MTGKKPDRSNGLDALERLKKVLIARGWNPKSTALEGAVRVDLNSAVSPFEDALAQIKIDYERLVFYMNFRDRVPKDNLQQTMEFVTRANLDMVIGNFELDLDDGLLRFKSSIDFTGVRLEEQLVHNAIQCSIDVVETYAKELVAVVRGEKAALEGIVDAES